MLPITNNGGVIRSLLKQANETDTYYYSEVKPFMMKLYVM